VLPTSAPGRLRPIRPGRRNGAIDPKPSLVFAERGHSTSDSSHFPGGAWSRLVLMPSELWVFWLELDGSFRACAYWLITHGERQAVFVRPMGRLLVPPTGRFDSSPIEGRAKLSTYANTPTSN
jgi:hypothetical protein